MAEKKVKVKVDVETNTAGSIAQLKELKKQLRETAAGSAEFKKLANEIDDLEDKIKGSKAGAADWIDTLESAGGPIGAIGGALNKAKVATVSFGTALKATGIGLIVAAVGGLVAAFNNVEGAGKKLEPLMIGLERILGGIFTALEPLIDAFLDLALKALPYVTKGVSIFYSGLVALFTLVKEGGVGIGKILKGVFTLDNDLIKEGWNQLTGSWSKTVEAFNATSVRFEEGTKRVTKTEKENLKQRTEAGNKALEERKKQMEAQDKLDEAALNKLKEQALQRANLQKEALEKEKQAALAKATTEAERQSIIKEYAAKEESLLLEIEAQKLAIEREFADKSYAAKVKDLEDKLALEKKGSAEYKSIQAELIQLQTEKLQKDGEFAEKASELAKKAAEDRKKNNEEALNKEELDLQLSRERGLVTEAEYQQQLYDMRVKYANSNEDLIKAEIDLLKFKNEEKKKLAEEERDTALNNIQAQFEDLDRANKQSELDFAQDLERLAQQKDLIKQQEEIELQNTDLSEFQRTEIRKKYSDQRRAISDQEIATEKAAAQAKHEIDMAYLGLAEQFGGLLQQIAGKNQALAIAGVIIQQAASIGQIIANTGIANAKAVAASPLTGGLPWVAINTATAALSIASTIAAAVKSIQQIKQSAAQAGVKGGGGGSAPTTAPQIAAPKVAATAAPTINTTGGQNPTQQIGETIAASRAPIRAYVVSGEVSSQQALDRRTSRAATFTGG